MIGTTDEDELGEAATDHFHNPRNAGRVEHPDAEGYAGGRRAGPFVRLTAQIRGDWIIEARFETYGCPAAIACASYLASEVSGLPLAEVRKWTSKRILQGLKGLPREKRYCADLAAEALKALLREYDSRVPER